jgi:hypothetical protein
LQNRENWFQSLFNCIKSIKLYKDVYIHTHSAVKER